jgi:hypothetical protein
MLEILETVFFGLTLVCLIVLALTNITIRNRIAKRVDALERAADRPSAVSEGVND